jgi:hypothetical protein
MAFFRDILPIYPNLPHQLPPTSSFNVLLIGQDYGSRVVIETAERVWTAVAKILFGAAPKQPHLAVYALMDPGLNLGLQRAASGHLAIPAANANVIADALDGMFVGDGSGEEWRASQVWPKYGKAGAGMGGLVAIFARGVGLDPGELYELETSDRYPIPVVGVRVDASPHWANVLARGIAQKFASLFDEFELAGPDAATPPDEYRPMSRNLFFTSPEVRDKIAAIKAGQSNESLAVVAGEAAELWHTRFSASTPIELHVGDDPSPPVTAAQRRDGRIGLIEGGGVFRRNVFRSAPDCLMRRMPLAEGLTVPTHLAVQAPAQFCTVCADLLNRKMGEKSEILARPALTLNNQRLQFDRVNWRQRARKVVSAAETIVRSNLGRHPPTWSLKLEVGGPSGFEIVDLELLGRSDALADFTSKPMKRIQFTGLAVTVTPPQGTDQRIALALSEAFANATRPPVLELTTDGGAQHEYDFGAKLTLSWSKNPWIYEVALSLVLRAPNNDIDPGHAVMACKIFPQLAFRYFRADSVTKDSAFPVVKTFEGTIACTVDNAVPTSAEPILEPLGLGELASGILGGALFADTNTTDYDSRFDFNIAAAATAGSQTLARAFAEAPAFTLKDAFWREGRKLARAVETIVVPVPDTRTFGGGAARYEYLIRRSVPVLPLWSWVFDYTKSNLSQTTQFVGVYSPGDADPAARTKGQMFRNMQYRWPPPGTTDDTNNYTAQFMKYPRQGDYDNLHLHPVPADEDMVEAPFCADGCLHFHWRWGVLAGPGPDPYSFLGWGDGRRGRGGHTTLGAPLIPPNQHLDVEAVRGTDPGVFDFLYKVTVNAPAMDQRQVLFEQGVGFAFSYEGTLRPIEFVRLAVVVNAVHGLLFKVTLDELLTKRFFQPFEYDVAVRKLFHGIYHQLQFYHVDVDRMLQEHVQQIPEGNRVDPTRPGSVMPEKL